MQGCRPSTEPVTAQHDHLFQPVVLHHVQGTETALTSGMQSASLQLVLVRRDHIAQPRTGQRPHGERETGTQDRR